MSIRRVGIVAMLLLGIATLAHAQPKTGVALLVGAADYANETSLLGAPFTYDSSGLSFGVDIQLAINETLSAGILVQLSAEEANVFNEAPLEKADVVNQATAAQIRFWPMEWGYVGAHVGIYSQSIDFKQFNPEDGSGFGYGFGGGIEVPVAERFNFVGAVQYDIVPGMDVLTDFADTEMSGTRIQVGMRYVTQP